MQGEKRTRYAIMKKLSERKAARNGYVQTSISLDEETHSAIVKRAIENDTTFSAVARELIEWGLMEVDNA